MQALRILLISICVTSIQSNSTTANNGTGRIAHGKPFVYEDYPYVVGIVLALKDINYQATCTGTLISELYVLTAAHCVFEENELANASRLTIHQYDLNSKTTQEVEKVYVPEDYGKRHADVCVLKNFRKFYSPMVSSQDYLVELKLWRTKIQRSEKTPNTGIEALDIMCNKDIYPNIYYLLKVLCTLPVSTSLPERMFSTLKRVKTYLRNTIAEMKGRFDTATKFVKLYGDMEDIGEEGLACTAIGFGVDENPEPKSHYEGQTADIILLSGAKSCALGILKSLNYWHEFICQKPSETHTCHGDSGGPVICNGVQYGLTSHSFTYTHAGASKCGSAETLVVYTYVKFYKDWIDNIIVQEKTSAAIRPHQRMYMVVVMLMCHVLTLKLYFNFNN